MPYYMYNHAHHMMNGGFEGCGILALLGVIFFVILVAVLIKILVHAKHSRNCCKEQPNQMQTLPKNEQMNHLALNILNERYAKGEIKKEEYEEKKKAIMT